jgi:hypothetical protein
MGEPRSGCVLPLRSPGLRRHSADAWATAAGVLEKALGSTQDIVNQPRRTDPQRASHEHWFSDMFDRLKLVGVDDLQIFQSQHFAFRDF